jgi:hypothetical protein
MMISELRDDEILDFLMTSDYHEDYKPSDFKYLLTKFRYFYRIISDRNRNNIYDSEFRENKLKEEIERLKGEISQHQISNAEMQNKLDLMKNKKLTLKERISGKIKFENED